MVLYGVVTAMNTSGTISSRLMSPINGSPADDNQHGKRPQRRKQQATIGNINAEGSDQQHQQSPCHRCPAAVHIVWRCKGGAGGFVWRGFIGGTLMSECCSSAEANLSSPSMKAKTRRFNTRQIPEITCGICPSACGCDKRTDQPHQTNQHNHKKGDIHAIAAINRIMQVTEHHIERTPDPQQFRAWITRCRGDFVLAAPDRLGGIECQRITIERQVTHIPPSCQHRRTLPI